MCGIVGYFRLREQAGFDVPRAVGRARDRMVHRGPDAAGLYTSPDGRCVLGSRRLSIRDLSDAGNQPISNEDGSVWSVFNGEIYNSDALRETLVRSGHRFRSRCDAEVIVHLYEEHGARLLDEIDGVFGFVIYDRAASRLFGARDRIGVKPLYYALSPSRFAFASEPKALLALPDVSRAARLDELSCYLAFGCLPGPPTLHRDIEKLEPGTRFELSDDGGFRSDRFWQFPPSVEEATDRPELEAAFDRALHSAVAKRSIADVPVGATLSGGIDSGLVVAQMSRSLGAPVPTFTIGYPGDAADRGSDLVHARVLAQARATDHRELVLDGPGFAEAFDDLPALADDPNASPSMLALLHLARHARRSGIRVLQIGEGADEVFGGYADARWLWSARRRLAFYRRLVSPGFADVLLRTCGDPVLRMLEHAPPLGLLSGAALEPLRRYAKNQAPYWGHGLVFPSLYRRRLLAQRPEAVEPYLRVRDRLGWEHDLRERPRLDQLALTDLLLQLPERLLMRTDRATMRHGIEARVPFVDPEVLRVAFRIPSRLRASPPKGFLRGYARGRLPAAIADRSKRGFPTARATFLAPAYLAEIREAVLAAPFLELSGMSGAAVRQLVVAAERGRPRMLAPIWSLYTLALWQRHWA